jgi:hypothetical protein
VSDDQREEFARMWDQAIEGHIANLSAPALDALVEKVRGQAPPTPTREQAMRRTLAEKTAQLQAVPRDHNGALGSMQAAIEATGGATPLPQPATPEPVAQQGGWAPNRAQGASSSDFVPISESDRNKALITDILNSRK